VAVPSIGRYDLIRNTILGERNLTMEEVGLVINYLLKNITLVIKE
jgi:hypothetical protein